MDRLEKTNPALRESLHIQYPTDCYYAEQSMIVMAKMDAIERMQYTPITPTYKWEPPQIWQNIFNILFKYDNKKGKVHFNIDSANKYHGYSF